MWGGGVEVVSIVYNTARLMGPKVSIACVWTCVSRPPLYYSQC